MVFGPVNFFLFAIIMKRKVSPNAQQGRTPPRTPTTPPRTPEPPTPPTPPTPAFHGPPSFVGQPMPTTPQSQVSTQPTSAPNAPIKTRTKPKLPKITKKDQGKKGGRKNGLGRARTRGLRLKKTKRKTKLFRKK